MISFEHWNFGAWNLFRIPDFVLRICLTDFRAVAGATGFLRHSAVIICAESYGMNRCEAIFGDIFPMKRNSVDLGLET